jgi:hypothetical protein
MAATLLADLVVIFHGVFILIAVFGGLLVFRWRRWAWFHVPAFLWAGFIEATGGICPLTPLENRLRDLGGGAAYQGDFIDRYLIPLIYPNDLTREIQIAMGIFVILFNMGVYALHWYRLQQKGS